MMIANDGLFTNLDVAEEAYAEAWELTWLLIKRNPKKFVHRLNVMSEKTPFVWNSSEERIEEFKKCFGVWLDLNQTLVNFLKKNEFDNEPFKLCCV